MVRPAFEFLDEHVCDGVNTQQAFVQAVKEEVQSARIALPGDDLRVVEEGVLEPLLTAIGAQVKVQAAHFGTDALLCFQYVRCKCFRFPTARFTEQYQTGVLGYRLK